MYPSRMFRVLENKKHLRRKDTHTMAKDNVIEFKKPEPFVDDQKSLSILRETQRIQCTAFGRRRSYNIYNFTNL